MAKEATLQVRMDAQLKQEAEQLFREIGTSFPEAVRMFARQSIAERRIPFVVGDAAKTAKTLPRTYARQEPLETHTEGAPSAFGMLAHYADPQKRKTEKDAWSQYAADKHAKEGRGQA